MLRIAFTGDACLASVFRESRGEAADFADWPAIQEAIGSHDLLVGNLECCLVDQRCCADAHAHSMATPAKPAASFLRTTGFTDVCLANNHMLDCGPAAIHVTREMLASHGIRVFGAGGDQAEAEKAVFTNYGKHTIALMGACDYSQYYARNDSGAGVAPLNKSRMGRRVRDAAAKADVVIVIMHADLEFSPVPGRWRQRLSRWLIDQGAHMVIQHHPHVLQGIETYHGGIIAYSLGNFIFRLRGNSYQEDKPGVFDSLVLRVDVDLEQPEPRLDYDIIPLRIGGGNLPYHVTAESRDAAVTRIDELSSLVENRSAHRHAWFTRCRFEAINRCRRIYYALARGEIGRALKETWRLAALPEDRRWLLGLLSAGYL